MAAEGVSGKEAKRIQRNQAGGQADMRAAKDAARNQGAPGTAPLDLQGGPDRQTTQTVIGQDNQAEPYDTFPGDNMPSRTGKKSGRERYEKVWENPPGTLQAASTGIQFGGPGQVDAAALTPAGNPRDEIKRRAGQQGVPRDLALAIAVVASKMDQTARDPQGGIGLFNLPPDKISLLHDPAKWRQNITAAMIYLRSLKHEHGSWDAAVVAHLGPKGAAAVRRAQHAIQSGKLEVPKGDPGIITLARPFDADPVWLSDFGVRKGAAGTGDYHTGIDIGAPDRTPLRALTGGQVVFAGAAGAAGQTVAVRDASKRIWYYSHLAYTQVAQGSRIKPGQEIGAVGMTGVATNPHLHLSVKVRGQWGNPLALAQRAFGVAPGQTKNDIVAAYDFNAPSAGGATVNPQAQASARSPMTGQASTTQEWQRILNSGPTSPETKVLAQRAGAVVPNG